MAPKAFADSNMLARLPFIFSLYLVSCSVRYNPNVISSILEEALQSLLVYCIVFVVSLFMRIYISGLVKNSNETSSCSLSQASLM